MTLGPRPFDESLEDLYEEAPCGHLSVLPDGKIVRANRTLLSWTGYSAEELYEGKRFSALLTVPGALLYETHCTPLLRLRGSIGEIALDLLCRDGAPLPILLSAVARRDPSGAPILFRIVILQAPRRREYERELLLARTQAEETAELLRIQREAAERKMAEQERILEAMRQMADGDLTTPVSIEPESSLSSLARGLDRMRQGILSQLREMEEHNAEILRLNAELRHQIEQRSRLLVESMRSAMESHPISEMDDISTEVQPLLPRGTLLTKRYRVEAALGKGAMGTVYEVQRISDERRFAAKVLNVKPDYRMMARFAREAQLLARLQHPNLITIVDVDITTDQLAYLVMELVRGTSLAELHTRYGDCEFMRTVLLQIANALTTVHSAGIVHRDLKPANVLISLGADGTSVRAKLADFGISRLLDINQEASDGAPSAGVAVTVESPARSGPLEAALDHPVRVAAIAPVTAVSAINSFEVPLDVRTRRAADVPPVHASPVAPPARPPSAPEPAGRESHRSDTLTQAGMLVGTLYYMAPELGGGMHLAQLPSDIFSFGIMAYEVLAGAMPFDKPPLLLAKHGGELRFKPLDEMCPGLSPDLSRLLERCLAINPASRPTAVELSAALGKS